jgi:hypothetical protein
MMVYSIRLKEWLINNAIFIMKRLKPILASDYNERILQRKFFDVFFYSLNKQSQSM